MISPRRSFCAVLGLCLGLGVMDVSVTGLAAAASVNPAPLVQPGLQSWTGGTGSYTLASTARIVVDSTYSSALTADANTFATDLASETGLTLSVVSAASANAGDIFLTEDSTQTVASGYKLAIGTTVTVTGKDTGGVFYGEQTIEQMLKLSATRNTLPQGSASDWPRETYRSQQIDVARHFQTVADLEQQIRLEAWMKMDELHLHLADDQAERVQSTTYPGLANVQSYSHADIATLVDYAHQYHVDIVPEFDLPGHSTVFVHYDNSLAFPCANLGLNGTAWYSVDGRILDVTKSATLTWVTNFVKEMAPLFKYSKYFHLGGDETPSSADLAKCPEVASYVQAQGYATDDDIFTAFQNKLDTVVKGLGKTMVTWNWNSDADVKENTDIVIDAWTGAASTYTGAGYKVIDTGQSSTYVVPHTVPGTTQGNIMNDGYWYGQSPSTAAGYLGMEVTNWGDGAQPSYPDGFYRSYSARPAQIIAAIDWGGPKASDAFAYESQVDAIGMPPGIAEVMPSGSQPVTGTAYDSNSTSAANAFDGSVTTSVDIPEDSAGDRAYVGLDLGAGNSAQISAVRYVPAMGSLTEGNTSTSLTAQNTMVGGQFQGCTSQSSGCTTLATVAYRPAADWHVLPVSNTGKYRYLRFLAASGQPAEAGEIQFMQAPASKISVSVSAPSTLSYTGTNTVTATVTNNGSTSIANLKVALQASSEDNGTPLTVTASSGNPTSVAANTSATATFTVSVPLDASLGTYRLVTTAGTPVGSATGFLQGIGSATTRLAQPAVVASIPTITEPASGAATGSLTLTNNWSSQVTVAWAPPSPNVTATAQTTTYPAATVSAGSTTVAAGKSATVNITLNSPTAGTAQIPMTVTDASGTISQRWDVTATIVAGIAQSYNSVGITSDSNRTPGNVGAGLDGSGSTLSSNALSGQGVTAGNAFTSGGFTFTWPGVAVDTADNVSATGQVLSVGKAGSALGLLALAGGGPVSGATGTITYSDGTTQSYSVSDAGWHTAPATGGPQPAITMSYCNYNNQQLTKNTYLYVNSIPLTAGKTVSTITLPNSSQLHVFAIAVS